MHGRTEQQGKKPFAAVVPAAVAVFVEREQDLKLSDIWNFLLLSNASQVRAGCPNERSNTAVFNLHFDIRLKLPASVNNNDLKGVLMRHHSPH
jgi:hypothetical protein